MKRILGKFLLCAAFAIASGATFAEGRDNDSPSDLPDGFPGLMRQTDGVMVRVPIDASGREDTNRAELRFHPKDRATPGDVKSRDPVALWSAAVDPGASDEVLGTNAPAGPDGDSPTWGWYYWYNVGWAYPYYYSYYYPTFYYNNYYYYSYYTSWNYYGYRYYWYNYYW